MSTARCPPNKSSSLLLRHDRCHAYCSTATCLYSENLMAYLSSQRMRHQDYFVHPKPVTIRRSGHLQQQRHGLRFAATASNYVTSMVIFGRDQIGNQGHTRQVHNGYIASGKNDVGWPCIQDPAVANIQNRDCLGLVSSSRKNKRGICRCRRTRVPLEVASRDHLRRDGAGKPLQLAPATHSNAKPLPEKHNTRDGPNKILDYAKNSTQVEIIEKEA